MTNHNRNLGICNDGIEATNLRLNKRGQIQYSTDHRKTWNNIVTTSQWINLFTAPIGDIDGDGNTDNVLQDIEDIRKQLEEGSGASKEEIQEINDKLDSLEASIKSIKPVPDDQILNLFK